MGANERRFQMMKYLCRVRHATMPFLAKKYGVSTRTVKRDIDELGNTIPFEIKTGRYEGGVYVMADYVWDVLYMEEAEINLIKMIRIIGIQGKVLNLKPDEIDILDNIITTYSEPRNKRI